MVKLKLAKYDLETGKFKRFLEPGGEFFYGGDQIQIDNPSYKCPDIHNEHILNDSEWSTLWKCLTGRGGGGIQQHWIPETLRLLSPVNLAPPKVDLVPAFREVKKGMKVEVYRVIRQGWWDLIGKKGKVEYIDEEAVVSDIFPVKVKIKGILTPQWLSHKELKKVK